MKCGGHRRVGDRIRSVSIYEQFIYLQTYLLIENFFSKSHHRFHITGHIELDYMEQTWGTDVKK